MDRKIEVFENVVYPMKRALAVMIDRHIAPSNDFLNGLWVLQDKYLELEKEQKQKYTQRGVIKNE